MANTLKAKFIKKFMLCIENGEAVYQCSVYLSNRYSHVLDLKDYNLGIQAGPRWRGHSDRHPALKIHVRP